MAVANLMTVAEVSDSMAKGIDTVLAMIHSGELKASNVSRSPNRPSWRIHPNDYQNYLESRSNQKGGV
ncbi:helix-turn-helix domain-containing protein [Mariniblastus sp.]|nr:helix-turn-helix domain-containing protein [Mariniblastus sp.]